MILCTEIIKNHKAKNQDLNFKMHLSQQDLKYATLATVSRCGMLWFSSDVVSSSMVFTNYLHKLKNIPLDEGDEEVTRGSQMFPAGINKDQGK